MSFTDKQLQRVMSSYMCHGYTVCLSSVCLYGLLPAGLVDNSASLDDILRVGRQVLFELVHRGFLAFTDRQVYVSTVAGDMFWQNNG